MWKIWDMLTCVSGGENGQSGSMNTWLNPCDVYLDFHLELWGD